MSNYTDLIKLRAVGSLNSSELQQWLTEELTNYSLALGYNPSSEDKIFLFAIAQFQSLIVKKYKAWLVDEIHRVLNMSLSGYYGKNFGKPNYAQLAKIMQQAANSRSDAYAIQNEIDGQKMKNEDKTSFETTLSIGWKFIHWTKDNGVDPELVKFVDFRQAYESNKIFEFTAKYKNTLPCVTDVI